MRAAHILGMAGEFCNLVGAFLLGVEMFFRARYRRRDAKLGALHDFAIANDLKSMYYDGVCVSDIDFRDKVAEKRAKKYGWVGIGFLLCGFALLVLYHWIEMKA